MRTHRSAGSGRRVSRRRVVVAALVVCCLGVIGGLAWSAADHGSHQTSKAAGSTGPATSASASTSGSGSPSTPTSESGPASPFASRSGAAQPSHTAPPGACSSPAACGFPSAADTGPRAGKLTAHSGNQEVKKNGEVISGWDLTGSLDVYADNVTIVDSRIDSSNWWAVNLRAGHTGLRILHSMLTGTPGAGPDNGGEDYAVSNMGAGDIEVGWDDVSVFTNALSMGNGYIHDDYVHGMVPFINRSGGYAHMDAVISDGNDTLGLLIKHNTLIDAAPLGKGPTSAIGLLPNMGPVQDTTVEDNWLAGGSYALYAGGPQASNVVVTGNVFSTEVAKFSGYYGVVADWNAAGKGNVWSNNRYSSGVLIKSSEISSSG